jgi:hypothetical protein
LFLVIGNKYGSVEENAVGMGEVAEFEKMWNLPVVRVRNQTNSLNPASLPEVPLLQCCGSELIFSDSDPQIFFSDADTDSDP